MQAKTFSAAGWNQNVIKVLDEHGLAGLEVGELTNENVASTQYAIRRIREALVQVAPSSTLWLFVAHDIAQPDTRITRHRRLWGSLGATFHIEPDCAQREWSRVFPDGVRFFGVVEAGDEQSQVFSLLRSSDSSWLVALDRKFSLDWLENALTLGWSSSRVSAPEELIRFAEQNDAVLVRAFGPTEEGVEGALAIGPSPLIASLEMAVKKA